MRRCLEGGKDVPLGDRLALERTRLASRRTLLAYLRTALAFLTAGGGMAEFLSGDLYRVLSGALVVAAPGIVLLGLWNFCRTESKWHSFRQEGER